MENKTLNILGEEWKIIICSEKEDSLLKNSDGYCDWTNKTIVIEREISGNLNDMNRYIKKVMRHEIIHAFLFESGLAECSGEAEAWALNECMVDWFARQGEKIYRAWVSAGAV